MQAGEPYVEDDWGRRRVAEDRPVVLICGHLAETRFAVGDGTYCDVHRQVRTIVRVWDGARQDGDPAVEPLKTEPPAWRQELDDFYRRDAG